MGIKEYIQKLTRRKTRFKELEEEQNIQKKLIERQKNSDERELDRYKEEYRKRRIKQELERVRKRQKYEAYYGNQILGVKNMFENHPKLFNRENLFSGNRWKEQERSIFFK